MKSIAIKFTFILFLFAFTKLIYAQSFTISITGQITEAKSNTAKIIKSRQVLKTFNIAEDGSFSDTLNLPQAGIYTFVYARESTSLYLAEGFKLEISVNPAEFDESLKYKGVGADCNNYLAKKFLINEELFGSYSDYAMDEDDFLHLRDSAETIYNDMLKSVDNIEFVIYEKLNLKYNNYLAINNYEGYHAYLTKDMSFKVSDNIHARLQGLDYSIAKDYKNYQSYKALVDQHYLADLDNLDKMDSVLIAIKEIKEPIIKEGIVQALTESYLAISNDHVLELYKAIKKNCADEEFMETFEEKYESFANLLKGNPSPKFNYQDVNGMMVALDDLKGKFVYIDVWATWCSPCMREIPFLKKLEEDYHDKNIAFVSISVDNKNAFDKWKKMVADKELKGYQLYADKSWKSDFVEAYQIRGIPTFILIDPQGNIVSASALRPSNPKLRSLFDDLLK